MSAPSGISAEHSYCSADLVDVDFEGGEGVSEGAVVQAEGAGFAVYGHRCGGAIPVFSYGC